MKNLVRVAAASPRVHIGCVSKNMEEIQNLYRKYALEADIVVTPELSLTGYTCGDLFGNSHLIESAGEAIVQLAEFTAGYGESGALLVVGAPFSYNGELFNCGIAIHDGEIVAVVPKTYLPNYGEFYEKRWFSGRHISARTVELKNEKKTVFGNDSIITLGNDGENVKVALEICEDLWTPVSPGRLHALNGAEIILNLSASNEVIGKEQYRKSLAGAMSASCICGYVYASAGRYESTSDLVFSGHNMMYENGKLLGEVKPFADGVLVRDFNLTKIRHDRISNKTFADCRRNFSCGDTAISGKNNSAGINCHKIFSEKKEFLGKVKMTPFVPSKNRLERCLSIFAMQVAGLQRRIETTHAECIVVGVSGGLDSTLALLVSAQAVRNLGLSPATVLGITMPGFGTTDRTRNNSVRLMELLGCQMREINIVKSVRQHFADIGHDEAVQDVTYENCQARERTQILMDIANKQNGFVVGTGDLSELALGWCTYNGDHMSMYGVNASIPKTLVRSLVDEVGHYMSQNGFEGIDKVVEDIIDTPVSPELLPPNEDGTIAQKTEETVGSYILHDFFLYYTLRYGMTPQEVYELCMTAIAQNQEYKFSADEVKKWQKVFYTRFFRQQFKRNCMPDGVKVGTVSVSPRGDLRLPSEIEFDEWL